MNLSLVVHAVLLAAVLTGTAAAFAQDAEDQAQADAAMRRVCRADYAAHCTGSEPPALLERACLSQYAVNLSASCRAALHKAQSASAEE
jgi:hypothetical protein